MESLPVDFAWLITGIAFMALEAFGASGIGLLFAGLAALCTGTLIWLKVIDTNAYIAQFAGFCLFTALWAGVLWKHIQHKRQKPTTSSTYTNMIGEEALVGEAGLRKGTEGEILWSGTRMRAQLVNTPLDMVPAGTRVIIKEVKGITALVTPANKD